MSTERPAILGGTPVLSRAHDEAERWPRFDERDEAAVLAVLRDGDLSLHPVTRALEDDYRQRFGVRHALAHANGTLALLAAFRAVGLGPGDEVIVPSATWWASAVPALWLGAVPVFAESEAQNAGLDPTDVERRITPRTRALVVVHLWGIPSRMDELLAIARRHRLKIIEDASHAHGATWRGRPCGALGDVGVFSLQSHKLAPAGEGGILLTDDDAVFASAASLGDVWRCWELPGPERRFAGTTFGIKTRMAALSAAVGRSQFARLDEHNAIRGDNCRRLEGGCAAAGLLPFTTPPASVRVYFEVLFRLPVTCPLSTERFVAAMNAEGARVSLPRYPLLHQQPLFTEGRWNNIARLPEPVRRYDPLDLPQTTAMAGTLVRYPVFTRPEPALVDAYIAATAQIMRHAREIAALSP
jgi:dTDP-4-amino-4,6-dideoxygalactose transaminase